jgi:hypothetical protein
MNLSTLITRIKARCGLYAIALPFENADEAIKEVIENVTLRTFSTYCPYYENFRFELTSLERIEKNANYETYLLPDVFSKREIMFVRDVRYDESDMSGLGYWGGGVPLLHGNMMRQAMLSNAGMQLTNRVIPKMTFKYEHPRKVTLYNILASSKVVFELAFMHDKSLASISPTEEESFFQLAILDVQDMLYQTLKHYNNIQTAFGNIDMKLDEWAQADDKRKQLLDEWDNVYHMDVVPITYG